MVKNSISGMRGIKNKNADITNTPTKHDKRYIAKCFNMTTNKFF